MDMQHSKLIIFILVLAFSPMSLKAQDEFQTYHIGNIFSLDIPVTMTLRDTSTPEGRAADRRIYSNVARYDSSFPDWRYAFIPTETVPSGMYARILVSVKRQNSITQKMVKEASKEDVIKLGETTRKEMESAKMEIVKWTPAQKRVIDGKYALVINYERKGLNGNVHVESYLFYLSDKQVEVTISYRTSESYYWASDFSRVPQSFKF